VAVAMAGLAWQPVLVERLAAGGGHLRCVILDPLGNHLHQKYLAGSGA